MKNPVWRYGCRTLYVIKRVRGIRNLAKKALFCWQKWKLHFSDEIDWTREKHIYQLLTWKPPPWTSVLRTLSGNWRCWPLTPHQVVFFIPIQWVKKRVLPPQKSKNYIPLHKNDGVSLCTFPKDKTTATSSKGTTNMYYFCTSTFTCAQRKSSSY